MISIHVGAYDYLVPKEVADSLVVKDAQIAELEAEVRRLSIMFDIANENWSKDIQARDQAKADLPPFVALAKFVAHKWNCQSFKVKDITDYSRGHRDCSCGLNDALAHPAVQRAIR